MTAVRERILDHLLLGHVAAQQREADGPGAGHAVRRLAWNTFARESRVGRAAARRPLAGRSRQLAPAPRRRTRRW